MKFNVNENVDCYWMLKYGGGKNCINTFVIITIHLLLKLFTFSSIINTLYIKKVNKCCYVKIHPYTYYENLKL